MRVLILFSCAVAIYFGSVFLWEAYLYASMTQKGVAKILRWETLEDGSRVTVQATYEFAYGSKKIISNSVVGQSLYINEPAAISYIQKASQKKWTVHYCPGRPERSTLDRKFPKGYLVRFVISILISIYFFILRKRFKSINKY